MDFRLEFTPQPSHHKIRIQDKIMLLGSCFTEHMYEKLMHYKFTAYQNPSGTLFNPMSIIRSLQSYMGAHPVDENDLCQQHGLWNHWDFHSSLSSPIKEDALANINSRLTTAHHFLLHADHLIITLGSAFVYEIDSHRIVANCHKYPASLFQKRLLHPDEIIRSFKDVFAALRLFNPTIKIMFTISPVRHLRDGFIENNKSKAVLIQVVSTLTDVETDVTYFPSYELIMDDLRDYRFFAEDMVHPNFQATRYVWEKFVTACIDGKTRESMKEIDQLLSAMHHSVMHPGSDEHSSFKSKFYALALACSQRYPALDFTKELNYFSS